MPERTVHWEEDRTLLVADLHWGKSQAFRAFGVPVPGHELDADLGRLGRALQRSGAARLVILGDLIHAREGLTVDVVAQVTAWRRRFPVPALLVRGNHDRHVRELPPGWEIETVPGVLHQGPFAWVHDPEPPRPAIPDTGSAPAPDAYVLCGHLHPAARLGRGRGALHLPAFHFGAHLGVLPSFGSFTGGAVLPRRPGDRVYAIAGDEVIALQAP
jgi:DNA ligase-associated metallophosphoesterase